MPNYTSKYCIIMWRAYGGKQGEQMSEEQAKA
jgi:hypothetical protein